MRFRKTVGMLLAALLSVASVSPVTAAEAAEDGSVYVLMNIPYADFYAEEGAADAITSATLNGKARNINVNGASYHQSEEAVTAEGIAGGTFPVKVTAEILEALEGRGAQVITDSSSVSYEMNVRGTVTEMVLNGADALQEAPSYSYYVLSEEPVCYKEAAISAIGTVTFGEVQGTAETGSVTGDAVIGGRHADIEISLSGAEIDPQTVSAAVITSDSGSSYALHHVVNIWRGTEIGWNLSDLDIGGETLTNIRYYLKDGTVKDYSCEIPISDAGYALMNIPYAEFYAAELGENDAAVDAVTSATKNKPRTGTLAGGSYHVDPEGTDISGVIYPVFVKDFAALADYTEITDESTVSVTVTNRGAESTTEYTGREALFEAPGYSYYKLTDKPTYYKTLNDDGSFSAVSGRASTVEGVTAEVTYNARHADIEMSLSGTDGIEQGDTVSGVILTDSDGAKYGLRHIANIWRTTELGWNYDEFDLLGKTIVNIRYITQDAVIDYPAEIILKKAASEITAEFEDAETVVLSGLPEDMENPVASVYYVEGEGREAVNVYLAENVSVEEGKAALDTAAVDGMSYIVVVNSDNYIPLTATAAYSAPEEPEEPEEPTEPTEPAKPEEPAKPVEETADYGIFGYYQYLRWIQAQKDAEAAAKAAEKGTAAEAPEQTVEPNVPAAVSELPFIDVTPGSEFYNDIAYVYDKGIMNGMSSTEFSEELPLTRGMIVTILYRVESEPEAAFTGAFDDVEDGLWYSNAVEWAAANGIVLGYGDGKYGPDDNVTREQLAAILYRYANFKGYDVSIGEDTNILSYDDAFEISDWAIPAVQWACGTDVLDSANTAAIRPTEAATRGEIAHAIHAFLENVAE